jgi:hypothetical protein
LPDEKSAFNRRQTLRHPGVRRCGCEPRFGRFAGGSGGTVTVDPVTELASATGGVTFVLAIGALTFPVGGTLAALPNQPAGHYAWSYPVTVAYQ